MTKKIYEKSEIGFALSWIGLYLVLMNAALQFCGGFDNLADKTIVQLSVPLICIVLLAVFSTVWIRQNGFMEKYGLCSFRKDLKTFLWFLPLLAMTCTNLKNGLALTAPLGVTLFMMFNLAIAGYVEEIIFRGFLFRAMAKDNLKNAIVVSAITFGAGHIVNLANTADKTGVILQICYAIVIGFLYTIIAYKGESLWPCILSHMFINASDVFASEHGPFSNLVTAVFGQASQVTEEACSAALIILISGAYSIWLWKHAE